MSSAIARETTRPSYQPPAYQPPQKSDCNSHSLAISLNFTENHTHVHEDKKHEEGGKAGKHGKNGKAGKHGKNEEAAEQESSYASPLHDGTQCRAMANSGAMTSAPQNELMGLLCQLLQMASASGVCNMGADSGMGGFLGSFGRQGF